MSDYRQMNDIYAKIGADLIANEDVLFDVRNSQATIIYLSSDFAKTDKGRLVLGQCEKVQDKYKWGIPADFTITLFEPNIVNKSQEAIKRIILHELLHVGIDVNSESDESYYVKPHDLEDFKYMIDTYGTDWDKVDDEPEFEANIEEWKEVRSDGK